VIAALLLSLAAVPATSLALTPTVITYVAVLTGPSESPPVASPGTGTAQVDFDAVNHSMRVRVTFSGLLAGSTASHVHSATAAPGTGTAGVATQVPRFIGFPVGVTSGTYDHTFDTSLASSWNPAFITANGGTVAGAEAAFGSSLAADTAYLNVHSTLFPGGEIRGFLVPAALTTLSPVHAWVGLRNSDDVGTQFDLRAELVKNGTVVADGSKRCITGLARNPAAATEVLVDWNSFPAVSLTTGDVLSIRLSARIGTNSNDTKCSGPGGSHGSAAGLRLYYDATARQSRFDATIPPAANANEYLHSDGKACGSTESTGVTAWTVDTTAPSASAAQCKDSAGLTFAGGNPYKVIGEWLMVPIP
jgi:hypothetical protein